MRAFVLALLLGAGAVYGQACPPVDLEDQKRREGECRAAGGEWARFGVHAHLCGVYSCARRTTDGGKPCRNRSECEHLCVTNNPSRIGTEITGQCTAVRTTFGCFTHVDGGRIVGRVCVD